MYGVRELVRGQGVVGGQVPDDGLHGVGHVASDVVMVVRLHPAGIGQQHKPPDGLGGPGEEAACHPLGQDDGVGRVCRGFPRPGQHLRAEYPPIAGVHLQRGQSLVGQFLARRQGQGVVALVAQVDVGDGLHSGGQLGGQAVGQGDAGVAEGRAVLLQQLDVRDAVPLLEAAVRAEDEPPHVEADAEAEQAHAQPHDADQVLRPVFQQLPDGDFQVV